MTSPKLAVSVLLLAAFTASGAALGGTPPYPVKRVEVAFPSGGVSLAGTLYLPDAPGRHPAIILIHGSGRATRGWPNALHAADFSAYGIATLTYDKRGVGASGGSFDENEDLEPLAADASAAARYLASRPEIDGARLGLWGRSQGAWVAPLAAAQLEHVAFVVLVVGGGVPVLEQQLFQSKAMLRRLGLDEADLQAVLRAQRALTAYYNSDEPAALQSEAQEAIKAIRDREWFERLPLRVVVDSRQVPPPAWVIAHREGPIRPLRQARFDPAGYLQRLKAPVLAVLAGSDDLTPTEETAARLAGLVPPAQLTARVFPGADHMLCAARADGELTQCPLLAGVEEFMRDWLVRQAAVPAADSGRSGGK
ncbi:MAG TPA: alpha/beta hydrolase [Candidatus Polarisedimenticolia bacterium]|jgi:hypothetical protein|nr:alpha/beta hydrolase [Candidatus Polarisedimenticolia bacterium]